ncbi:hypothetical protein P3T23_007897 [Paraburkholderia sp. GAS448]
MTAAPQRSADESYWNMSTHAPGGNMPLVPHQAFDGAGKFQLTPACPNCPAN